MYFRDPQWSNNGGLVVEIIEVERQCLFMFEFDEIDFVIFLVLNGKGSL